MSDCCNPIVCQFEGSYHQSGVKKFPFHFFAEGFSSAGERFREGVKVMSSSTVSSVCV